MAVVASGVDDVEEAGGGDDDDDLGGEWRVLDGSMRCNQQRAARLATRRRSSVRE